MSAADDLRALTAAATPGSWAQDDDLVRGPRGGYIMHVAWDGLADAELIVWLRNHADALADLIDAARLFVDPATPHEATCYSREAAVRAPRECPCDCGLDDLRKALDALEVIQELAAHAQTMLDNERNTQ